ncbi:hypothetical protein ACOMHN_047020 [Nucella lapillus]
MKPAAGLSATIQRRNAVRNFHQTWVNRTVPFLMQGLDHDDQFKVLRAMEEIMNTSCVRFVPRTKETDYINIVKAGGCFSPVGRTGGKQSLYLAANCYYHGVIIHELMHALGFWHEHSRPDRDSYISIMWDNIAFDHRSNFEKYGTDMIDVLGAPYDYGSIMHYRNNTFATDRSHITINHTHPLPGRGYGAEGGAIPHRRLEAQAAVPMHSRTPHNGVKEENSTLVGSEVTYSCHAGYRLYGSRGRSCLDQGFWTGHLPSCLPDPDVVLHVCDFDSQMINPFCGWVNDTSPGDPGTADLTWIPRSRPTPSNGTGPEEDHTMGSEEGWYIYLEASDRRPDQRARLLSPQLYFGPQQGALCMMFYYSMYGRDMGTLNVYQRGQSSSPQATDVLLFSMSGDQGMNWKLAAITLPSQGIFQMVVEAVVGSGFHSDIAVDDLVIGPCSSLLQLDSSKRERYTYRPTTTTTTTTTTTNTTTATATTTTTTATATTTTTTATATTTTTTTTTATATTTTTTTTATATTTTTTATTTTTTTTATTTTTTTTTTATAILKGGN